MCRISALSFHPFLWFHLWDSWDLHIWEYHPLPQVRPSYYYYYYYYYTSLKLVCQSFQIQPNAWITNNWIVWWHGAHNLAIPMWSVLVLWFVQISLCWYKMALLSSRGMCPYMVNLYIVVGFELLTSHKFFAMLGRLLGGDCVNIGILKSSIMIFGPFIGIFKIRIFLMEQKEIAS